MHQTINSRLTFAFFVTAFAASCGGGTPVCDSSSPDGCGGGGAGGIGGDGGGSAGFGGFGAGGVAGAGGSTPGCTGDFQCRKSQFCEFQNNACGPVAFLVAPGSGASSGASPPAMDIAVAPPRNTGMCVNRFMACDDVFSPVCGCDNKTYSNDCIRQSSGVSKAFDGPCETQIITVGQGGACDAAQNLVCASGLFCEMSAKACSMRGSSGTCQISPQQCVAISSPVCGCDGNTYQNDCIRRAKGQSLAHPGACGPTLAGLGEACGAALGISCEKSLVCDPQPNQCMNPKFVGTCRAQASSACSKEFAPVCGCDGRTYSNDCMRLSAGVTKAQDGECKAAQRFIEAGVWGGQHVELLAKQPAIGGSLQFDCGRAEITSPLEVDANGNFMWKATYVLQGGPNIAPAPPPIKRDAIITGAVSGNQMKFTVQIAGSMSVSGFGLSLGTPGTFTFCL